MTRRYQYISRHLDTVGDGSGSIQQNVNGALTPTIFRVNPPDNHREVLAITRMIMLIEGSGGFRGEGYGTIAAGLTNGVDVGLFDLETDVQVQSFVNGETPKTNAQWGEFCYDVTLKDWGVGDQFLLMRWTFSRSGVAIHLSQERGLYFGALIQDDLSSLVAHRMMFQGFRGETPLPDFVPT